MPAIVSVNSPLAGMARFYKALRHIQLLHVFLLLLVQSDLTHAEPDNRETIFWTVSNFPPFTILSGPHRRQGIADKRLEILTESLLDFRHEVIEASVPRVIEEIKTKPNVCNVAFEKTPEREAIMEFSAAPIVWTLPNGVIYLRHRFELFKPFLNDRGQLRLDEFLSGGHSRRVAIITGRSFGAGIDAVLKKHYGEASVVIVPASDNIASRLLKFVNQKEYEAVIGYAVELSYVTSQLRLQESDFGFLPVAEEPPLLPAYVACSKSKFGKRVMAAINHALATGSTLRKMEAAYRAFLDEESLTLFERLRKQAIAIK